MFGEEMVIDVTNIMGVFKYSEATVLQVVYVFI